MDMLLLRVLGDPGSILGIDHVARAGLPAFLVVHTPDLKVPLNVVRRRVANG